MCMKQYHRGESYVPVAVAALGCTEHVHIVYIVCKEASVRVQKRAEFMCAKCSLCANTSVHGVGVKNVHSVHTRLYYATSRMHSIGEI